MEKSRWKNFTQNKKQGFIMTEKGIELLDKVFQKHKVKKKTEKQKERQEDLSTRKKKKLFYGEEAKLLPKKINLYKQYSYQQWQCF